MFGIAGSWMVESCVEEAVDEFDEFVKDAEKTAGSRGKMRLIFVKEPVTGIIEAWSLHENNTVLVKDYKSFANTWTIVGGRQL